MHYLSGEHKCVENYLTVMEAEYKRIVNSTLQEIRMNISCKYHEGKDNRSKAYPLHTLDEVQENVNTWTEKFC